MRIRRPIDVDLMLISQNADCMRHDSLTEFCRFRDILMAPLQQKSKLSGKR